MIDVLTRKVFVSNIGVIDSAHGVTPVGMLFYKNLKQNIWRWISRGKKKH